MNIPPEVAGELREQMMVFIRNRCGEIAQGSDVEAREMRAREAEKATKKQGGNVEMFDPESFDLSPSAASPRLKPEGSASPAPSLKRRSFLGE
jgi:hypothetical protein